MKFTNSCLQVKFIQDAKYLIGRGNLPKNLAVITIDKVRVISNVEINCYKRK